MPRVHHLQTNLSAGELDPGMRGRVDTGAYQNGCKTLTNVALYNTGGGGRRPGLRRAASIGADKCRLIPFEVDDANEFKVVIYNGGFKVYGSDESLLATVGSAPWTEAQLFDITFAQVNDQMVLCHQAWAPRIITWAGGTTFTLGLFSFEEASNGARVYQPFYKFADPSVTLTPSGNTGSITLTASSAIFDASYVGTRLRVHDNEILVTGYTSSTVITGTIKTEKLVGELLPNAFQTKTGTKRIEVTHLAHNLSTGATITFEGANSITTQTYNGSTVDVDTVDAADLNGAQTITVIDADHYYFTVPGFDGTGDALSTTDGGGPNIRFEGAGIATRDWSEQVFSAKRGYPGAVCFHESRLWFASSPSLPNGIWSSWINRFRNFEVDQGTEIESVQAIVASDQSSGIKHMLSNRHLQVFTSASEFYCPQPRDSTLTPGNFSCQRQSQFGIGQARPVSFDGATIYAQGNGKSIREYIFSDVEQAYNATLISLLSGHLIKDPVDSAGLAGSTQRGEQYSFFVNDDGTLAVFHSARAEKMAGWTPWTTPNGTFVSVCVVGRRTFFIVLRDGVYYLEEMYALDDDGILDHQSTQTAVEATTSWTLPVPYRGHDVDVFSAGEWLGPIACDADTGALEIATASEEIVVGFAPDFEIETLPPQAQMGPSTTSFTEKSRIAECNVYFQETQNCVINGSDSVTATEFSGPKQFFNRGYSREPTLQLTQSVPGKIRVLAIKSKVIA